MSKMAFPCCEACYHKYIEKDEKTIKQSFLEEKFGKDAVAKYQFAVIDKSYEEFLKSRNHALPKECVVQYNNKEVVLCTCSCHIEGRMVMH